VQNDLLIAFIHKFYTTKESDDVRTSISPNSIWLVKSRLDTTGHVLRVEPVELVVSSVSRRACRAVLFDKLDTAKMHGLDTSNVSRRDVTSQVEFELYAVRITCLACKRQSGTLHHTTTS